MASAWSHGGDTVLNLIKDWGWLVGIAWLMVIILWPSRPQWLRRGVVTVGAVHQEPLDGAPATPPGEPVSDQLQSLLAKAKEPSPPIPDEPLVILFRGYALPAHNSLWSTMEQVTRNCFDQGGWPGLFARLLKQHLLTDAELQLANVENAIAGTGDVHFEEEFEKFFFNYNKMLLFAYQAWQLERDWILSLREPWLAQDGDFHRQLEDLAKGIDRESLKRLTSGPQEARLLVRKALR